MATRDEEQENRSNARRPHLSAAGDDKEDGRDATGKVAGDGARRRTNMSGTPPAEATNSNALADGKASMADTVAVKGQPVKLKTVGGTSELSLRDAFYWAPEMFTRYTYKTRDELSLALGNYYATTMYELLQNGQVYVDADDGTERALSALDMQPHLCGDPLISSREPHCLNLDGVSYDGGPGGFHLYTEDEERAVRAVTWNGNHFSAKGKKEFDAQASNEENASASTRAEDVDATGKNKQRAKGAKAKAQKENGNAKSTKKAPGAAPVRDRKLPANKEQVAASTKAAPVAATAEAVGESISDYDSRHGSEVRPFDLTQLDDDEQSQPAPSSTYTVAQVALKELWSECDQKQAEKNCEIRRLQQDKRSLTKANEKLKEEHQKLQAHNQELQDKNREALEELSKFEKMQAEKDGKISDVEEKLATYTQEVQGKMQTLKEANEKLKEEHQKLQADNQELRDKNRVALEEELSKFEKMKAEKDGKISDVEEKLATYTQEVHGKMQTLKEANEKLEKENQKLQADNQELQDKNRVALEEELSKFEKMKAEKDGKISDVEEKLATYTQEVQGKMQTLKELETEHQKLQAHNQYLRNKNRTQQEAIHQLEGEKLIMESEIARLDEQVGNLVLQANFADGVIRLARRHRIIPEEQDDDIDD